MEDPIEGSVSPDQQNACPNQKVMFTAKLSNVCPAAETIKWSGGNNPASGTGTSFTTNFSTPGNNTVTATTNDGSSMSYTLNIFENSGIDWVGRYPFSNDPNTLKSPFKEDVEKFLAALYNAQSGLKGNGEPNKNKEPIPPSVNIIEIYRPPERAYLMHYAYDIANGLISPSSVPS